MEEMLEGINYEVPLEGGILPLEDCEEAIKLITTIILMGKIINEKTLKKGAVQKHFEESLG